MLMRIIKMLFYKLRYRGRISFGGIVQFIKPRKQIHIKNGRITIGKNFSIKKSAYLAAVDGGQIIIGDNVYLNNNCMIVARNNITIQNHCSFGPNVILYDHDHNFGKNGIEKGYKTLPIVVERNCWIGGNVTILRGTRIGEGSIIGAGTVVQGDIPPYSVVTSDRNLTIRPIQKI